MSKSSLVVPSAAVKTMSNPFAFSTLPLGVVRRSGSTSETRTGEVRVVRRSHDLVKVDSDLFSEHERRRSCGGQSHYSHANKRLAQVP